MPCGSRQITIISYISLMNKGKLKKKWKVPRYCFFVHGLNISFSRCKRYQFFVFLAWHPNRYRGCSDCGPSEAEHLKKYQTLAATPQAFHTGTLPPHPTRYFHEFAPDSHETLHVCFIWCDKIERWDLFFCFINGKIRKAWHQSLTYIEKNQKSVKLVKNMYITLSDF